MTYDPVTLTNYCNTNYFLNFQPRPKSEFVYTKSPVAEVNGDVKDASELRLIFFSSLLLCDTDAS